MPTYPRTLLLFAAALISTSPVVGCSTPNGSSDPESAAAVPAVDAPDCPLPEPAVQAASATDDPPEPKPPATTVAVDYWLLLAHPSPEADFDAVPEALRPLAEQIVQEQGPAAFEVLERAGARVDETDTAEVDARHASYQHRVQVQGDRLRFIGEIEVHDSRVTPYRPSLETRVSIPVGEPVLLGHGDLVEESGVRLLYVVRATLS